MIKSKLHRPSKKIHDVGLDGTIILVSTGNVSRENRTDDWDDLKSLNKISEQKTTLLFSFYM